MERQTAAKTQKSSVSTHHLQRSGEPSAPVHPMAELQRSIGNRATRHLIRSPYIQAKLQVSNPGDPLEEEADRTADTVMRMPEPGGLAAVQRKPLSSQISRLASHDSEQVDEEKG